MKVAEAVQHMTKSYLHRILDSFTKDLSKPDEERSREIIVRNQDELTDPARIRTVIRRERPFSDQILQSYILEALVNRPENAASEAEIAEEVIALEKSVLCEAADPDILRYEDARGVEILRAVLEVALDDDNISTEELKLIRRLREKVGIREKTQRIILAQLNHFPRAGNALHSPSELKGLLNDLQRRGVVFYCNGLDGGQYLLPNEIIDGVKQALSIEMTRTGWDKLLEHLTSAQLGEILEDAGLPKSGRKSDLQERVKLAGLAPSKSLDALAHEDLHSVLDSLPGAKVSGSKAQRIARIVEYFDKLVSRDVPDEAPPGELYYRYLIELAARDREILLANRVIKKDRDMEWAFEEGTRHLFSEKLGISLISPNGSDHCDGSFEMGKRGDILMWDNKSKEDVYSFPPSHMRQFKRYIRDSPARVGCFLIIVPKIGDASAQMAARLKVECGTDTDIALITAENLVWVAEQWMKNGNGRGFNPEVFNITGILSRGMLEQRMRLFL